MVGGLFTVEQASYRDEILTYLPLCHVAERIFSGMGPLHSGYIINFAENLETVPRHLTCMQTVKYPL